jgi:glycosyltransferase involved in cell wall biosynthesis/O-antigen/teichoic acid export membrane protein
MHSQKSRSHWPLTLLMGGSSLLNLFLPLVLVRILEASQVGQYKLFFLYAVTAPWLLLAAGFNNGIYFWAGQTTARDKAFSATWSLQLCWSGGILGLGALCFPLLSKLPSSFLTEPWFFTFLILSIAAGLPAQFFEEASIAQGHTRSAAWFAAGWEVLKSISLLAAAFFTRSVDGIVLIYFVVIALKLTVSTFLVLKKKYAVFSIWGNPQTRPVLRYAIPASIAAACGIVLGYCDQFILGEQLSAAAFAAYSLGCLSIPPLLIFEQSVNKVLLPPLSQAFLESQEHSMALFKKAVLDLGLWLIPASVGLGFFAGPITRLLFTNRYPEAEGFLKVYSLSYLVYIIPYDAWARAKGFSGWILRTSAIFAVVSLAATLVGALLFGAYGALGFLLFTQFLLRIYGLLAMKKQLHWKLREALPGRFLLLFLFTSVVLGALCSQAVGVFASETLGLITMGSIFWLCYILLWVPRTLRHETVLLNSRKVLILTQYLNIGGLERMILNLSQALRKQNSWQPTVWVYDEIPGAQTLDEAFLDTPVVRKHKAQGFSFALPFQILGYCRKNQIDLIHAHDLGALIYAVITKFLSLGRLRVVYTLHSFVHLKKEKKYYFYEMFFGFFADVVTVVSPQLKEGFPNLGVFSPRIHVVENGIPLLEPLKSPDEKTALREKLLLSHSNSFWILNLARLHPGKGQVEALELWNHLPEEVQEKATLLFVGSETSKDFRGQLEAKAKQCRHSENIVFVGGSLEPDRWLLASDLMISASREEGLPLSPIEALSVGLPLFISKIVGHRLLEKYAVTFSLENLPAAAAQLQGLLQNLSLDYQVLKPCEILDRFSAARMAESYAAYYAQDFSTPRES